MKPYIEKRAVEIGTYIVEKSATVRQAAKQFGVCKSTVHKDVTLRLQQIRPDIADSIQQVLQLNKAERHLRGGAATHRKYKGEAL